MITVTSLESVVNAEKALFFLTKKGCSNCEKTRPMIEQFEKENPDVLVFTYEAQSAEDELPKFFPTIRMFPGVFGLKEGKVVSATNAIPNYESFGMGLLPIGDKKAQAFDIGRALERMENDIKALQAFKAFIRDSIELEEMPSAPKEEFLPPNQNTEAPEVCESCQ